MSGKQVVVAPKIENVPMKNWPLKDLKTTFVIPDFERKVDRNHMKRMVDAILKNEFYDTVIRGVKLPDGKIQVIDAQHRIQAFIIVHEKYGVQKYDFHLQLFEPKFARMIYRKLNQGKKLVTADHTLALDDGGVPFFNELRDLCYHYRNDERIDFVGVLYAWNYCTTKVSKGRIDMLDAILRSINKEAIDTLKVWLQAMKDTAGPLTGNPLYGMPLFRNIARVGFEKKYDYNDYVNLIRKLHRVQIPEEISRVKSHHGVKLGYEFIITKVLREKLK